MDNKYTNIFNHIANDANGYPIVWEKSLPSIYKILLPYKDADTLPEEAQKLPDESQNEDEIKWIAGAQDGTTIYHCSYSADEKKLNKILSLLKSLSEQINEHDISQLYSLVKKGTTLTIIDSLLKKLPQEDINLQKLYSFFYWLTLNSPDREVIKFSIALLGSYSIEQTELFHLLGMHEEFTLYSAVALTKTLKNPEEIEKNLLSLAKKVNGWGRINVVRYLIENPSAKTKDWLLREGYKNKVMNEYLAYSCAKAGELKIALEQNNVDTSFLSSAAQIILALINGGPAEDIYDYEDSGLVCLNYLKHLTKHTLTDIKILHSVIVILDFITTELDDSNLNWDRNIKTIITEKAQQIIQQKHWIPLIEKNLQDKNDLKFNYAAYIYSQLGYDSWQIRFNRQKKYKTNQWLFLMQTEDKQKIEQVIQLAKEQNDFSTIPTGPTLKLFTDSKYAVHDVLDTILQELDRFPGLAEELILIGLQSPLIRNRIMALNAIEALERQQWSNEILINLKKLAKIEPDEEIQQRLIHMLS